MTDRFEFKYRPAKGWGRVWIRKPESWVMYYIGINPTSGNFSVASRVRILAESDYRRLMKALNEKEAKDGSN